MENAAIYYETTDFQLPLRFHKCALTVMLTVKGQLLKSSWISHKIIIIVLATLTIENVRHVQGSIQANVGLQFVQSCELVYLVYLNDTILERQEVYMILLCFHNMFRHYS